MILKFYLPIIALLLLVFFYLTQGWLKQYKKTALVGFVVLTLSASVIYYLLGSFDILNSIYNDGNINNASLKQIEKELNSNKAFNIDLALEYAGIDSDEHQGNLSKKSKSYLAKILTNDPFNIDAMNLIAIDAYVNNDYNQAIKIWHAILAMLEPGSDDYNSIKFALAQAMQENSLLLNTNDAANHDIVSDVINITLDISSDVKARFGQDAYVFIFAKAPNLNIPVAVKKYMIKDLPTTIVLSKNDAMVASNNLSNYKEVLVQARVSSDNNAIKSYGDRESNLVPVEVGGSVSLTIE